jgi:hypothetical protein
MLLTLKVVPSPHFIPKLLCQFQVIAGIGSPNCIESAAIQRPLKADNCQAVG